MTRKRDYDHADEVGGSISGAERIVPVIIDIVGSVSSVVDFGGGTGAWLRTFQEATGCRVLLIDSPEVEETLLINRGDFQAVDLRYQLPIVERFDLAICVECAEHLPENRAEALVGALTAAAGIVVFSAGVPGQAGKGHINLQPHEFWKSLFEQRGFVCHDLLRPRLIWESTVPWWYRQNLFVFTGPDRDLSSDGTRFLPEGFELVHQTVLENLRTWGFLDHVRRLLPSLVLAVKRRL